MPRSVQLSQGAAGGVAAGAGAPSGAAAAGAGPAAGSGDIAVGTGQQLSNDDFRKMLLGGKK